MKNMRTVAQASLDMARATALTPSFRATFASTCHPEKHIFDATKQSSSSSSNNSNSGSNSTVAAVAAAVAAAAAAAAVAAAAAAAEAAAAEAAAAEAAAAAAAVVQLYGPVIKETYIPEQALRHHHP